jgi:electron transport complex protein RnfG
VTKEPKARADMKKKVDAIKEVVPAFNNQPLKDKYDVCESGTCLAFYPAKENGKLVGTAIETFTNKGFSGEIKLMIGFLPNGDIYNTSVLDYKETPGLGDKIDRSKSSFPLQFNGKNPKTFILKVKKDGGDVDAITAATISSRAFCDAVQRAYDFYRKGERH